MTLSEYQSKRRFDHTPEPEGRTDGRGARGALVFVVQKHAASHLHYDFRLELQGVLKSWAVPKGPSMNPTDKRLAMMVEDHPFDYRTFEGIIPAGNYGAGTVMLWDQGTYYAAGAEDKAGTESLMREGLRKGNVQFVLQGQKLHGEFSLVKLKGKEDNSWLLIKKRDRFASTSGEQDEDRSVSTGRTMEEIASNKRGQNLEHQAESEDSTEKEKRKAKPARTGRANTRKAKLVPGKTGRRDRFPELIDPMLATLADAPFDQAGWVFEIKWDGYRAIADLRDRQVRLYSRKKLLLNDRFPEVASAVEPLNDAVLDGEIVVLDDSGRPRFSLLQSYHNTQLGHLVYYVFDLLYYQGRNLTAEPLLERKKILQSILPDSPHLRYSEHVAEHGAELYLVAKEKGLEGIIGKDGASRYEIGVRSDCWLKIKTLLQQEAVIGGFTRPRGSRKGIGALVLGIYQGDDFVYVGHTGGGLDTKEISDLRARLEPLIIPKSPFVVTPKTNTPATWVKPKLVVEVRFREWTPDQVMRMPIFLGLRDDKDPRQVRREQPAPTKNIVPQAKLKLLADDKRDGRRRESKSPLKLLGRQQGGAPSVLPHGTETLAKEAVRPPGRHKSDEPEFTNLDKVWFPEDGYTKGDIIDYYRRIAPMILPFLQERPESLHRFPNGIKSKGFFQKDLEEHPSWVRTVPIPSGSHGGPIDYLVCDDERTLLYMANLGCIEINPWNSRADSLDNPDYCVIDLDPQGVGFDQVVQAARGVREVLEDSGAVGFCKTSGATGMHVYIPFGARYTTEQSVEFAKLVAYLVNRRLPDITTVERDLHRRKDGIYLDYLQNRRGQTLASIYSVRPRPGAPVSTPLRWDEVKKGLDPSKFTIKTIIRRLDRVGDVWKGVLGPGIDLQKCLNKLQEQVEQ